MATTTQQFNHNMSDTDQTINMFNTTFNERAKTAKGFGNN
jgi:hypothetical protein